MVTAPANIYEFGPFRMNTVKRLLLRDGEVVPLTPKAFEVLVSLVESNDRVLEKSELMTTVWPDSFVEESNLTQSVFMLRKALGESSGEHRYIVTVPGRGYRFVASVNRLAGEDGDVVFKRHMRSHITAGWEEESDSRNEIHSVQASRPELPIAEDLRNEAGRKSRLILLVSCALAAGVLAAAVYVKTSRKPAGPATILDVKSLAVLPFKPMGEQESNETLEIGMADALITRLSNSRIVVRPTSSVIKYHKSEQDLSATGRELRVDSLLIGRTQIFGDRVRVTVQLVSAGDQRSLWAEKFDAKYADIITLQDSISEQIMRTLEVKLSSQERQQSTKRHTGNVEAFQAYSKGLLCWNRRTIDGFRKAIDYFNEAIKIDSEYALAYAGLANCYTSLSAYGANPPAESLPRAKEAAQRALEIDNSLAEAHTSLAHILFIYDWNWEAAEREYNLAIELNRNYPAAHQWYSVFLSSMGRHEDALARAKLAYELDPVSLPIVRDLTRALYLAGQYDQAIAVSTKAIELNRNTYHLGSPLEMVYEQKGLYDQAIEVRLRACEIAGYKPQAIASLRDEYQSLGWKGYWQKELGRTKELARREYVRPYSLATLYTRLGQNEKAFEWLEKAYAEHSDQLIFLKADPIFADLRSDSRFQYLLSRVGLERQ